LSGPNTCWLSRIIEGWDEHTVTWDNQPAITALNRVTIPQSTSPHEDYEDIDITQLVQDIVDNPETSHGFELSLVTEEYYRCMVFTSSDYFDPARRPKLVITYIAPVIANFSYTVEVEDKTVSFFNQSQNATSFLWDFGDGIHSILENPEHTYLQFGDYEVTLVASNEFYADTVTKLVKVCERPVADFTYQLDGYQLTLTNLSQHALAYYWDFGDSTYSSLENPTHVYLDEGEYTVRLIAYNDCDSDTLSVYIYLYAPAVAGFSFTVEDETVFFINQSQESTSYLWDFGDGNYSVQENPIHFYQQYGDYEVSLIASNSNSSDTVVQLVSICLGPIADFDYLTNGFYLKLKNYSQNATHYFWDFGDGSFSYLGSPSHYYTDEGIFNVRLIAYNDCRPDTMTRIIGVCKSPEADFDYTCSQMKITFQNFSVHYDSCVWDFGDGSGSVLREPEHIFSAEGNYKVTLTVMRYCVDDTLTNEQTKQIASPCSPMAIFSYKINEMEVTFTNNSSNATFFSWDFGDDETSNETEPIHTYGEVGDYEVQLIAKNDHGSDTARSLINVTSVPGLTGETSIMVYPNPVKDIMTVKIMGHNGETLRLELYNLFGQCVGTKIIKSENEITMISFGVSHLQAGCYSLRIIGSNGIRTKKVILE
jgi:PKD repeat protein